MSAVAGVLAAVAVAVGLGAVAVSLVSAARARRSRDLRALGLVGRSIAARAPARRHDDGRVAAREVAEAVRARFGARRVVLAVGPLVEQAGEPLPEAVRLVDLVPPSEAFRFGPGAARWHRRTVPEAVRRWMDVRGAGEVLVAPIAPGTPRATGPPTRPAPVAACSRCTTPPAPAPGAGVRRRVRWCAAS